MNGPILNLQQMINFDNSESDYSESNKIIQKKIKIQKKKRITVK